MPPQIIFIHIQKTSGSSLVKSLIEQNVTDERRIGGLRAYLKNRDADCIHGHIPHGYHYFARRPVEYITMLRDPLDRAVSNYYFIRDLVRTDLWKRHPLRDYADSVTIVEFYQNPQHADIQARNMAGFFYHKAYPFLHRSSFFRKKLVQAAKKNLDNCLAFGLKSEFETSVKYFQHALGWSVYQPFPYQAQTKKRPSLKEIDELNPLVLPALRKEHELDYELYEYAKERFQERVEAETIAA